MCHCSFDIAAHLPEAWEPVFAKHGIAHVEPEFPRRLSEDFRLDDFAGPTFLLQDVLDEIEIFVC